MKIGNKLCAAVCAALMLVPLAACSLGNQASTQAAKTADSDSSQNQIVGMVTSVVGNQVTLAIGTLNDSGSGNTSSGSASGTEKQKTSSSSSAASTASSVSSAASAASSESSSSSEKSEDSDSSTSLITLTGDIQTVLIPVGLSLTTEKENSSGGSQEGGQGDAPASGSGAAEGQASQKTQDFSSITVGMVLQITEETLSDGTQGIAEVAVLSE